MKEQMEGMTVSYKVCYAIIHPGDNGQSPFGCKSPRQGIYDDCILGEVRLKSPK